MCNAVVGNTLYLYGGIVEVGRGEKTREVTLDDMWALDLAKLEGWRCVRLHSVAEDQFKEDGAVSSGDEGMDGSSEDEDDSDDMDEE